MKITATFTPRSDAEWRDWLDQHHATQAEIWVVYFKEGSGQAGIDYESSVEEALCFGWVDSLIQKLDGERYARKFNPRRPGSFWSASNKRRMEKLLAEGRVTPAGLEKYNPQAAEFSDEGAVAIRQGRKPIPPEVLAEVESSPRAWLEFQKLPPSLQRQYGAWLANAKRPETRRKRLAELLAALEQGEKLGLK